MNQNGSSLISLLVSIAIGAILVGVTSQLMSNLDKYDSFHDAKAVKKDLSRKYQRLLKNEAAVINTKNHDENKALANHENGIIAAPKGDMQSLAVVDKNNVLQIPKTGLFFDLHGVKVTAEDNPSFKLYVNWESLGQKSYASNLKIDFLVNPINERVLPLKLVNDNLKQYQSREVTNCHMVVGTTSSDVCTSCDPDNRVLGFTRTYKASSLAVTTVSCPEGFIIATMLPAFGCNSTNRTSFTTGERDGTCTQSTGLVGGCFSSSPLEMTCRALCCKLPE